MNPPLQFKLDEITAHTRSLVPAERLRRTEEFVSELQTSGLEAGMLQVGTTAPSFSLPSASGKRVHSADLLALGSLVIKFFRGRWDPYDITELEVWNDVLPALRQRGALLVAISPQLERQNAFTAEQHHLSFPVLSDAGCALAEAFRLVYTVPESMQAHFRSMLVNVPFLNGDKSWRLPLPATYVIGQDGTIQFAQAFADHRRRPDPDAIMQTLPAGKAHA